MLHVACQQAVQKLCVLRIVLASAWQRLDSLDHYSWSEHLSMMPPINTASFYDNLMFKSTPRCTGAEAPTLHEKTLIPDGQPSISEVMQPKA